MNTNPITILIKLELCPEDRQRLDFLLLRMAMIIEQSEPIAKLSDTAVNPDRAPIEVPNEVAENPDLVAAAEEILAPTPVEPVAEPTPEVKPVSLAEFQKAVTLAVSKSAEAKQTVKAIINKYASSVSAVPEDKRADIMAELEKI